MRPAEGVDDPARRNVDSTRQRPVDQGWSGVPSSRDQARDSDGRIVMNRLSVLAVGALVLGLAGTGWAQKSVSHTVASKVTATIETIDSTSRLIALKTEDGQVETFQAGPEVKRFNELKVGDNVTFHYTESLAFDLRKPGEAGG